MTTTQTGNGATTGYEADLWRLVSRKLSESPVGRLGRGRRRASLARLARMKQGR